MMIRMAFALTYLLTLEWFLIIFTFLTFPVTAVGLLQRVKQMAHSAEVIVGLLIYQTQSSSLLS